MWQIGEVALLTPWVARLLEWLAVVVPRLSRPGGRTLSTNCGVGARWDLGPAPPTRKSPG